MILRPGKELAPSSDFTEEGQFRRYSYQVDDVLATLNEIVKKSSLLSTK
jgi:hypothetical protein